MEPEFEILQPRPGARRPPSAPRPQRPLRTPIRSPAASGPMPRGHSLPPALRPRRHLIPANLQNAYRKLGTLEVAYTLPLRDGGLYFIDFGNGRGYSGMSDGLRERLRVHRLCAKVMSLDTENVQVWVTDLLPDPRGDERKLHDAVFAGARDVLTNTNREFEGEFPGEVHGASCGCGKCSAFELLEFGT